MCVVVWYVWVCLFCDMVGVEVFVYGVMYAIVVQCLCAVLYFVVVDVCLMTVCCRVCSCYLVVCTVIRSCVLGHIQYTSKHNTSKPTVTTATQTQHKHSQ